MRNLLIAACAALSVAGCVTAEPPNTASGKPEVIVRAPVAAVKAALISRALDRRYALTKDTEYMLQMDKPTDNFGAALLLGSKYDGIPNERLVYTFAPQGDGVRVVTALMFVTNPGSSFERITSINVGEGVDAAQASLIDVKQQVEAPLTPPPAASPAPRRAKPAARPVAAAPAAPAAERVPGT